MQTSLHFPSRLSPDAVKIMKSTIFALLFSLAAIASFCQDLRITTHNDLGEELPYTYIYVNGRAVAVTDSVGMGIVKGGKIAIGDTVSVSQIGTEPRWVVYDEALKQKGEHKFILAEKFREITAEDAVIRVDQAEFYRKNTRDSRTMENSFLPYYFNADFKITLLFADQKQVAIAGRARGGYRVMVDYNISRRPIEIETESDTTGLSEIVEETLNDALFYDDAWFLVQARKKKAPDVRYSYRGKINGCRVFRIGFPANENRAYDRQILAHIEEDAKLLRYSSYERVDIVNGTRHTMWSEYESFYTNPRRAGKTDIVGVTNLSMYGRKNGIAIDLQLTNIEYEK